MFRSRKKVPQLVLSGEDIELYRGPVSDVPLSEDTILETSIALYKDPEPCYIHRGAVRQHLTAKITEMLQNGGEPDFALLEHYTGIEPIDYAVLEDAQ